MQRLFTWRIPRRIVSIGAILVALVLVTVTSPLLLLAAVIADAKQDWGRHRWVRLLGFVSLYLWNELFGLSGLGVLWVITGFGWRMHSAWSYRLHGWTHGRWTANLLWGVDKILGGRLEIRNRDVVEPAPVAIFSRHMSFLDAVIPSVLVAHKRRNAPRHILKDGLRWEPCIDILGHRTPNHFVDRAVGGDAALDAIRAVGATADEFGSLIIFPEGSFRQPKRFARAIERLRESSPELADRAAKLRHVLPPRPNGSRALLEGAPDVDVVMVAHSGFEGFTTIKEILANIPLDQRVVIECRRIPRAEIPMEPDAFNLWLLGQFEWIDAFAEAQANDGTSRAAMASQHHEEPAMSAIDLTNNGLTNDDLTNNDESTDETTETTQKRVTKAS